MNVSKVYTVRMIRSRLCLFAVIFLSSLIRSEALQKFQVSNRYLMAVVLTRENSISSKVVHIYNYLKVPVLLAAATFEDFSISRLRLPLEVSPKVKTLVIALRDGRMNALRSRRVYLGRCFIETQDANGSRRDSGQGIMHAYLFLSPYYIGTEDQIFIPERVITQQNTSTTSNRGTNTSSRPSTPLSNASNAINRQDVVVSARVSGDASGSNRTLRIRWPRNNLPLHDLFVLQVAK